MNSTPLDESLITAISRDSATAIRSSPLIVNLSPSIPENDHTSTRSTQGPTVKQETVQRKHHEDVRWFLAAGSGSFGRPPPEAGVQQFLEKVFVPVIGTFRRVGEILISCDLRVGIGFQYVEVSPVVHPQVDARIAA